EAPHRAWYERVAKFAHQSTSRLVNDEEPNESCKALVKALGEAGLLAATVALSPGDRLDLRTLCLAREALAVEHGLADLAFAMQGLGAGPISLFGSAEQRRRWLPDVAAGRAIPAFALTERVAGSDVASISLPAVSDGPGHVRLSGEKTFITNGGIADWYVVFA